MMSVISLQFHTKFVGEKSGVAV